MLWTLTNDDSIVYKQEYFDYICSRISDGQKSNILVIDFDDGKHTTKKRKDSVKPEDVGIDLIHRCVKSMNLESVGTMIAFAVPAGTPVLPHVHTTGYHENHFQHIMGLTPSGVVEGLIVNGRSYTVKSNRIVLNVKHNHWVQAQKENSIWITPFGGKWAA